jgi:hypothetical protein
MHTTLEQSPSQIGNESDFRPLDQRRELRYVIPRGMKLQVQASPQDEPVEVELHDISRNGVGIIPPEALITFPFGSQRVFAQVRYCQPSGSGFVVGALIREVVAENGALSPMLNV